MPVLKIIGCSVGKVAWRRVVTESLGILLAQQSKGTPGLRVGGCAKINPINSQDGRTVPQVLFAAPTAGTLPRPLS